jgi:hypothetical protein
MKMRLLTLAGFLGISTIAAAADLGDGFVAHEWGTFTSVQGQDGLQMTWDPLVISELPKFVYDSAHTRSALGIVVSGKLGSFCRQRMETPVIYFYSDQARAVDVSVRFPEGAVTEWFPDKAAGVAGFSLMGRGVPALLWKQVQILPSSTPTPALPMDDTGSHYYAARETDASYVQTSTDKKSETEKFLFYRGIGGFQAPLTVKLDASHPRSVLLTNSGSEELPSLFLCQVGADGNVLWSASERLAAGQTRASGVSYAEGVGSASLAAALRSALVRQGLYEKEAAAMVKTWETSWLHEPGLRVLYTLPRAWTDRTLPLTISPAPKALERVMVGRAEIITPAMEQALLSDVNRYIAASAEQRPQIVAETRALGMGRFTEAALRRLSLGVERSRDFMLLSSELLRAATEPVK